MFDKKETISKRDLFFKKYDRVYNFYQQKFPYEDPLTKIYEEIDRINNKDEKEDGDEAKLKTFFFHANVLIKGLDNFSSHFLYNFN